MKKLRMAGIKKLKIGRDNIIKILIDKMLESKNSNYDEVVKTEMIDEKLWCTHFEWTLGEADEYKKWFIEFFQKKITPRRPKYRLEKEWQWFNLMYGLKIKDENRL